MVVERGEGSYVYAGGSRYIDAVAGFGVASLGHSHPRWVRAVAEQAGKLTVSPLETEELGRYLRALGEALPEGLRQVALFSGGAEAVEAAVRLAQIRAGRPGVLAFGGGFHGKTAGVRYVRHPESSEAGLLAPPWLRTAEFPACRRHDAVGYGSCREEATEALEALSSRRDLDDVGVVLVEAVQGTAGNIPPVRGFLPALRRLCDERGWTLVLDESITGFGRTGRLFACEYFDVRPDAMVLSKGLGGGFPLSAVCAGPELWEGSAFGGASGTTTAFGGNPLACAAGLATLEIVTGPRFMEGVREVAGHAAVRLRELAAASPRVAWPRGVGLMLGFDLVDPESGDLADAGECRAMLRSCRDRGLLVAAHVPRVRINPPLTVRREEVDEIFDVLESVLE